MDERSLVGRSSAWSTTVPYSTLIRWLKVRDLLWSLPAEVVLGVNQGLDSNTCTASNWPDPMALLEHVHCSINNPLVFNGRFYLTIGQLF